MNKYALIQSNVVKRTDYWPELPEAMRMLGYVPCPPEVDAGWTYDGSNFSPPVPVLPSLAEAKATKIKEAYEIVRRRIDGDLINLYSPGERDRWVHLKAQSDEVLDNGATETSVPELAFEAQQYGATLTDYAAIIRQRAADFMQFKSTLAARRLQHKDAIQALTDVQAVLDYDLSDLETIGTV